MVNHRGYTHSPPISGRIRPDVDPNIPEESRCVKEDTRPPYGIDSTDPRCVVCLSGVFRGCEVADKKTIKHDKPRNINEYSRCTPGKSRRTSVADIRGGGGSGGGSSGGGGSGPHLSWVSIPSPETLPPGPCSSQCKISYLKFINKLILLL